MVMLGRGLHDFSKIFASLLSCVAICALLIACYPVTRSKGVIRDEQGFPVANAIVRIGGRSAKSEKLITKPDGVFDFGDIKITSHQEPIEIELTVEKEGFDRFTKKLVFNATNSDEIVLRRSMY